MVPVVPFPNLGEGSFGMSELRDVVPLQDALNKTLLDMLVGSESQALPQRYALGLEIERHRALVAVERGEAPVQRSEVRAADRVRYDAGEPHAPASLTAAVHARGGRVDDGRSAAREHVSATRDGALILG